MAQTHGVIKSIGKTQQVSEKFQKREFVLELEAGTSYPQTVLFELQQASCDIIDSYYEGQAVRVDYNLKGRQWTDKEGAVKTFNTLQCWKIQPVNN